MSENEIVLDDSPLPEVDLTPDPSIAEAAGMFPYVTYDARSGEILTHGVGTKEALEFMATLEQPMLAQRGAAATHYVHAGRVVPKTPSIARVDGTVIRDLPVPCVLWVDNVRYDVPDGTAELEFDHSGTYRVLVKGARYLDAVLEVTHEDQASD